MARQTTRIARSIAASATAAFTVSALLLTASTATAQEASKAQQKCINDMNKRAASIAKAQGKDSTACVKAAGAADTSKLGTPPTAQDCLTNDVKGKVGKSINQLIAKETDLCASEPPAYGFAGSTTVNAATTGQGVALIGDLFGPDLDAVTIDATYPDGDAPKCQTELAKRSTSLGDALWKLARKGKKNALKGKTAPPVASGLELQLAVMGYVDDDDKGKAGKAAGKLADKVTATCGKTAATPAELFPGLCSGAASYADLATCATTLARCRFCRTLAASDGFDTDCDAFDDGDAGNDTCEGFASARVITDTGDLITGPLAHGRVGDYLIENGTARFIIQNVGQRDMYSVGCFGGNIIDAELVGVPGKDNFLEIQPAVNLETVVNAQTVEIVNDGADGTAAIIRTCGPDDILDFVNASTVVEDIGLPFPAAADDFDNDVVACTEYILESDASSVRMVTTIVNNEASDLPLYVGDYLNAAGEVELWGSTAAAGIGEQLTHTGDLGVLSYIGFGEALGVDYSHATLPDPSSAFGSSFFATSGVTYVMHSNAIVSVLLGGAPPTFVVPAGGSNSYARYFGVGDGSGSNAVDLENQIKGTTSGTLQGCVTVGGAPAPGARVTAGPETAGALTAVSSNWTTDAAGCYSGTLPVGSYGVAGWRDGTLFEGGGPAPTVHAVVIAEGALTVQDIALPSTGVLSVTVTDESSAPIPGRVTVVGFDPSPEIILPPTLFDATGVFRDQNDIVPFGLTAFGYADATGGVSFDLEPGSYQVFVSRGTEYSAFDAPLTITAGATTNVAAQIGHVIDTSGFVSSDFHVHGIASADSRVSQTDRVFQFAGEGIDNVVMTDHHVHTDLDPRIADLGFSSFLASTIGEEVTTWDSGHYNAYPMTIDPTRPSGGSTDWGKAAPPGMDFTSHGAYIATPAEVEALATGGANSTVDTIVQINHIDSHFVPLEIDTSLVPPASAISAIDKEKFRIDPSTGNLYHHFPALELWNGASRGHQSEFLDGRIGIWFNLLNQGLLTTFIADTDTHRYTSLRSAGARTWTAASTDAPASISDAEIAQSVLAGKATGGQGIYVQARLVANEDPGLVADLTLAGSTLVSITDAVAGVDLEIDVQAPAWAPYDRIEVYANAATTADIDVPQLFTATPTVVLNAGVDFTVSSTNVFPGVPGATRLDASVTVPFASLAGDAWFVVLVRGVDGVSEPMFPIFPSSLDQDGNTTLGDLLDGNLDENGTMALGATNALYVDADGVPGFQAPLAP